MVSSNNNTLLVGQAHFISEVYEDQSMTTNAFIPPIISEHQSRLLAKGTNKLLKQQLPQLVVKINSPLRKETQKYESEGYIRASSFTNQVHSK
jgi:hypothetical protein